MHTQTPYQPTHRGSRLRLHALARLDRLPSLQLHILFAALVPVVGRPRLRPHAVCKNEGGDKKGGGQDQALFAAPVPVVWRMPSAGR